jgi:thymidylate kinase
LSNEPSAAGSGALPSPGVISVDGPLGSGKTPFCASLQAVLESHHGPTALTQALSSTPLGSFLRKAQFELAGLPLAYAAAADRWLQIETVVQPAIQRAEFVVIDRYVLTAIALDGFGAQANIEQILAPYGAAPVPMRSYLVFAPFDYRVTRLRAKGLLNKYDNWFMALTDEEECYRLAAQFLRSRGWRIEIIEQPLDSLDQPAFEQLAADIAIEAMSGY